MRPDFAALCSKYPELAACAKRRRVGGGASFDWTDDHTLRTLTEVLLRDTFGVHVVLPADRLTPPVPNRSHYIDWLRGLLSEDGEEHRVLDVGVGASCIYPLIGASKHGSWTFHGTDVEAESLRHAEENVARNPHLAARIELSLVTPCYALQRAVTDALLVRRVGSDADLNDGDPHRPITAALTGFIGGELRAAGRGPVRLALVAAGADRLAAVEACEAAYYQPGDTLPPVDDKLLYAAVMTNPPFYDVNEAVQPSHRTACTGAAHEMSTPGGEVAFVGALLADSLVLRRRVRWYTAMLGKEGSVRVLTKVLKREGACEVVTTVFQGAGNADDEDVGSARGSGRTRRWGIAWTFHPARPVALPPMDAHIDTTTQALRATATALPTTPATPASPAPPDAPALVLVGERVRLAAARYVELHGGSPGAPVDEAEGGGWVVHVAGWPVRVLATPGAALAPPGAGAVGAVGDVAVTVRVALDPSTAPPLGGDGADRPSPAVVFKAFTELLRAEVLRTNRRWRRLLVLAAPSEAANVSLSP